MRITIALIAMTFVILGLSPKTGALPGGCRCDDLVDRSSSIAKAEYLVRAAKSLLMGDAPLRRRALETSGRFEGNNLDESFAGKVHLDKLA